MTCMDKYPKYIRCSDLFLIKRLRSGQHWSSGYTETFFNCHCSKLIEIPRRRKFRVWSVEYLYNPECFPHDMNFICLFKEYECKFRETIREALTFLFADIHYKICSCSPTENSNHKTSMPNDVRQKRQFLLGCKDPGY